MATSGWSSSHHLEPDDDWLVAQLAELAEAAGLPTVVTNQVHYATAGGHRLQDVLVCIRHGATLDEARELLLPNGEYRLKGGDELAAIGAGTARPARPSGLGGGHAQAAAIGQACALDLNFERYRFPGFTVPEGETPFSYLYQRAHEGLRVRYRPITRQSVKQLAHELEIIERTNLAEFFLIVWDLMEFARKNGIIGQGRGSAGDSIVAYCLGITKVDPIAHKLLFERFINEARTLPDIDIDFDVNRREEVIQYLYTRYGEDHAAMVCTVITYRARSAVREVAKALGFPLEAVDRVAKALDTRDASDVARDLALDGGFGWLFEEAGLDMAAEAIPPGRDGRGQTDGAAGSVTRQPSDSPWHGSARPALALPLRPDLADAESRAREAAGRPRRAALQRERLGAAAPAVGARPVGGIGQVRGLGAEALRLPVALDRSLHRGRGTTARPEPSSERPERGAGGPGERDADRGAPPRRASLRRAGRVIRAPAPRNRWQWLLQLCARDRRLPAPPGDPRRRDARHPHPADRPRPDRARDDARKSGHPVRQGGHRGAGAGEDRPPLAADAGRGQRVPRQDRARHGRANRPRRTPPRRPRGVQDDPRRRHGRHVPDREPCPDAGAAEEPAGALRGPGGAGRDHSPRPDPGQRGPPVPATESGPGAGHLPPSEPAAHPRGHAGRDPLPGAGDADRDRGVRLHRPRGGHLPQGDGLASVPPEDAGRARSVRGRRHAHRRSPRRTARTSSSAARPSPSSASRGPTRRPSPRSPTTPPG